ncbi:MAG: IPT/TIG domain-containing protein, partial [Myxococcales bacterium]|nr:IPT/TIG domain-containing protein [Myxococcales bacterium]
FGASLRLADYFGLPGSVRAIGLGRGAAYVGTAYFRGADGRPVENPVTCEGDRGCHHRLGGDLATLVDSELHIVETIPQARGVSSTRGLVEVQLDRIVDPAQLEARGSELLVVSRGAAPISGFVTARVTERGTRLVFRPSSELPADVELSVRVSAELRGLRGERLSSDYRFRFTTAMSPAPTLEGLSVAFGSWRGGTEVRVVGSGFDTSTEVRFGRQLAEVVSRTPNELRVRTPELTAARFENRLVGVEVANGAQRVFLPALFTYVGDPTIEAIGVWRSGRIEGSELLFERGELVGIRGRGFGPSTAVRLNGRAVEGAERLDDSTLVFPLPNAVVGPVRVDVVNDPSVEGGVATDESLSVVFEPSWNAGGPMHRRGTLVVRWSEYDEDVELSSAPEGEEPVFLSTLVMPSRVVRARLGEGLLAVLLEGSQAIRVYDLTNPYDPAFVLEIPNPEAVPHGEFQVFGTRWISRDESILRVGSLLSSAWEEVELTGLRDATLRADELFALVNEGPTASRLEQRSLAEPTVVASTTTLDFAATRVAASEQRLVAWSSSDAEVFAGLDALESLGRVTASALRAPGASFDALVAQGELLAVSYASFPARFELYDLDVEGATTGVLDARFVAALRTPAFTGLDLELTEHWLTASTRFNAWSFQIPLARVVGAPEAIVAPDAPIALQVSGARQAWEDVRVAVRELSSGTVVAGGTTSGAGTLVFQPTDAFGAADRYAFTLAVQPYEAIDGGQLEHDLPWETRSVPLFGAAPLAIERVEPQVIPVGVSSRLAIYGAGLDRVNEVELGAIGATIVASDGTRLEVDVTPSAAGTFGLRVASAEDSARLPAAVAVVAPLTLVGVDTPFPDGGIPVAGRGPVGILGSGLARAAIHLVATGSGSVASSANELITVAVGDARRDWSSTPCTPGTTYDLLAMRDDGASARLDAALRCVDDLAPRLVRHITFAPARPIELGFDEVVRVTRFRVTSTNQDYGTPVETDVTSRFALEHAGPQVVVRYTAAAALGTDRRFRFEIDVEDLAGNPYAYTADYQAADTLAPRELVLALFGSGEPLGGDGRLTLARGQRYVLTPTAHDNIALDRNLTVRVRASRDGVVFEPLVFEPYGYGIGGRVGLDVLETDTSLVLRLEVTDQSGNRATRDVAISVGEPAFEIAPLVTTPATPEERARVRLELRASGAEVSLLRSAQLRVLSRPVAVEETVLDATTRLFVAHVVAPTLDELRAALGDASDRIPVSLELRYGTTGRVTHADSFPLVRDVTPPTLTVVSPVGGAAVPRGEPVDVLLEVDDRFGIDRVEASIDGGAFTALSDPNVFSFVPGPGAEVTLAFRAYDRNENLAETSLALRIVEAEDEVPFVALHAPEPDALLRERATTPVEVELANVTIAQLFVDLFGDPDASGNPAPLTITRGEGDPERFFVDLSLPEVAADTIAVLRLEHRPASGPAIVARRRVRILQDDAVGASMALASIPAENVLGGSHVRIVSEPPTLPDLDAEGSRVVWEDPQGSATEELALGEL